MMGGAYRTTTEGIELQFGSNHIGHFLFTNLIMPKLLAAPAPRVVNASSTGYYLGPVRFEDWNFEDGKKYKQWEAYGQSKAANILFTKSLVAKLGEKGLKAYSLHPGVAGTNLAGGLGEADFAEMGELFLGRNVCSILYALADEHYRCEIQGARRPSWNR